MSNFCNKKFVVSASEYFNSFDKNKSVSNSETDPKAMLKKFINSFFDFRPAPSAILTGTEIYALRSCEIIPNFSSFGKRVVTEYISFTNSKLKFHAFKFLCGFSVMIRFYIKINISNYSSHI